VRHEAADEHVADPALAWPLGLIPAGRAGRLGRKSRAVKALTAKLRVDRALADGDAVAGAQDLGGLRRRAGGPLGPQRGRLGEQLGMAAHRAGISALDRPQALQPTSLVGGDPAVQRSPRERPQAPVGVLVGLADQRADQPATLGRGKPGVGRLGDHPVAEQCDLLSLVAWAAGGWGHGASFGMVRAGQGRAASNPAPQALPRAGSWWSQATPRR